VGVAESYRGETSTLGAVVVRADRAVETVSLGECTVGGTDATDAIADVVADLGRPDARYVFVAGVAPAWFNVVDLPTLHEAVDRPVLAVSFEASDGLEDAIREAFDGDARDERLAAYRALPERKAVAVGDASEGEVDAGDGEDDAGDNAGEDDGTTARTVYARAVGLGDAHAAAVVRGFTFEGGRPEPVRVAREVARAGDALRRGDS